MKKLQKMLNETAEIPVWGQSYSDAFTIVRRSYPDFIKLTDLAIDFIDKRGIKDLETLQQYDLNLSNNNGRFLMFLIVS